MEFDVGGQELPPMPADSGRGIFVFVEEALPVGRNSSTTRTGRLLRLEIEQYGGYGQAESAAICSRWQRRSRVGEHMGRSFHDRRTVRAPFTPVSLRGGPPWTCIAVSSPMSPNDLRHPSS